MIMQKSKDIKIYFYLLNFIYNYVIIIDEFSV